MFQHRMFVLECADSDPLTGRWQEKAVVTPFDTFALDATTFTHQGKRWYLWAQNPRISKATQTCISPKWLTRGR